MRRTSGIILLYILLMNVFTPIASAHWEGGTPYPWYLEMLEWGIIVVGLLGTLIMVLKKKPKLDDEKETEPPKS